MDNNEFLTWVNTRFGTDISSDCQALLATGGAIQEKKALSMVLALRSGDELARQSRTLTAKGNSYIPDDGIIYDMSVLNEPL